jgi:CheY-like chemotaxis protein
MRVQDPSGNGVPVAAKTRKILLIDDEADMREVAQLSLEVIGGWQVTTARSGSEGLLLARTEQPDAILLDLMMPGMDGPAVLEQLRASPATKGVPVIYLTGKAQQYSANRLPGSRPDAVIAKPFDPLELSRQVAAALDWES